MENQSTNALCCPEVIDYGTTEAQFCGPALSYTQRTRHRWAHHWADTWNAHRIYCNLSGHQHNIHCFIPNQSLLHGVPKLAALFQTGLIQFVVYGFQRDIVHCTILTLLILTPIMTYALYHVCSV